MNKNILKQIFETVNQTEEYDFEYISSFGYGSIGLSIFNHLYQKYVENDSKESEFKLVDEIENMIQSHPEISLSLNYGIAGLTELMNIVNYESTVFDEDDFLEDIYEALTEGCIEYIKEKNFDFYAGSMGVISVLENAYYRIPHLIKPKIEKIIQSFENEKINITSFITELDFEEDEDGNPITVNCPHYNNGLAHGLPAIILVLSKLNKINPNNYLKSLIYDTISLIKKHKNPIIKDNEQIFLERIYLNKPNEYKARLAWCYSDLTLGWALLKAGKNLDDVELINLGNETLEHSLIIEKTNKLASNTHLICLCHGSAGNAYIYKRIYEETKNPIFDEASKKWALFAAQNYEKGEIHFEYKLNKYITNHTIMDGLLGYGLFLIAEEFPESQSWNTFMLMN
ncbi:MAG: hypothetical protein IPQ19_08125 [Bacteroidetes bacterium]|nr:hypothetical protein [Bacteroidota bacterium]